MRVLAIGNSHISSLEDLLQAHPERRPEGLDLDLVPLNFCYDDHHVIPSGKGTIRFPGLPQMSPLEYDASNYDAIAIIGTFIGGDGIFRSLVARTCFTPLADHQVAALHPSQIVKGQNGKFYNRPPVVAAGDISPGLETHQIVSLECLKALLDFQVQFRLDLLRLDRLASLSPRVLWFESPFPKRSVLLSQWGADTPAQARPPY
jgi:hypothetical protein